MGVDGIEGVVENGRIRLRGDISLPEKTRVVVIVADQETRPAPHLRSPHLAHPEQALEFRKQVIEGPADAKV